MAYRFEACGNCGAPVQRSEDGRGVSCPYCGAADRPGLDPARLAASVRADFASAESFLERTASTLSSAFPERTVVERKGGLLSAKKTVGLKVACDDGEFRLRREGTGVVAERVHVVRGIALKTERLPPAEWLTSLCESLAEMARMNAGAAEALKRLGAS